MQIARNVLTMAVNAQQHHAVVDEHPDGLNMFRWSCFCRKTGQWVPTRAHAGDLGRQHERRSTPKPSGPKGVRDLLKFD